MVLRKSLPMRLDFFVS